MDRMFNLDSIELDTEMNKSIAKVNRETETKRIKQQYDRQRKPADIRPDQLVLWHVQEQGASKSKKLNRKWVGPYRVVEVNHPKVKLADLNGKLKAVHLNHVKQIECEKPLAIFRGRGRPRIQRGR